MNDKRYGEIQVLQEIGGVFLNNVLEPLAFQDGGLAAAARFHGARLAVRRTEGAFA